MEWYIMNSNGMNGTSSRIGCELANGGFLIADECEEELDTILKVLKSDSIAARKLRNHLAFIDLPTKTLVPLLMSLAEEESDDEDDDEEDLGLPKEYSTERIFSLAIKLLAFLTQSKSNNLHQLSEEERETRNLEKKMLLGIKMRFLKSDINKVILEHNLHFLAECKDHNLAPHQYETVNFTLYLYRNLLFIPDPEDAKFGPGSINIGILRRMFMHGTKNFILQLHTSRQSNFWSVALVQLLSLIYMNRKGSAYFNSTPSASDPESRTCSEACSAYNKFVSMLMNMDKSSEEDDEEKDQSTEDILAAVVAAESEARNKYPTCPLAPSSIVSIATKGYAVEECGFRSKRQSSPNESCLLKNNENEHCKCSDCDDTLMATSESSGSGKHSPVETATRPERCSSSVAVTASSKSCCEFSDSRTHTAENTTEMMQTDSKTTDSDSGKGSGSRDSKSTEHDILENKIYYSVAKLCVRDCLDDLASSFLTHGYADLICNLKTILLFENKEKLSPLYLLWLISHFLPIYRTKAFSFIYIRHVFTLDIIGYLVYLATQASEQIILTEKHNQDTSLLVRISSHILRALHELIDTIEFYVEKEAEKEQPGRADEDEQYTKDYLTTLQYFMTQVQEMRHVFVLLIRSFNSDTHKITYLHEAIYANHKFLLLVERIRHLQQNAGASGQIFDMTTHVECFATRKIMLQYSYILENFEHNSTEINDCVFTMMHHIAGDVKRPEVLLQLPIIKAFTYIWETQQLKYMPSECMDLMEYVLQECVALTESDPTTATRMLFGDALIDSTDDDSSQGSLSKPSSPQARPQFSSTPLTDTDIDFLHQLFFEHSGHPDVAEKVRGGLSEYGLDMSIEEVSHNLKQLGLVNTGHEECDMQTGQEEESSDDEEWLKNCQNEKQVLEKLQQKLIDANMPNAVTWLQQLFMQIAFVKIGGRGSGVSHPEEPSILHNFLLQQAIPMVAFTEQQEEYLQNTQFRRILSLIGLSMGEGSNQVFPRIPHEWTPSELYHKAALFSDNPEKYLPDEGKTLLEKLFSAEANTAEMTTIPGPSSNDGVSDKKDLDVEQYNHMWPMLVN